MKSRLALALVVAMAASVGAQSAAQARVSGPVVDSVAGGCLALQNEYDRLQAEYIRLNDDGVTPAENVRRQQIIGRINEIGSQWQRICAGRFGSIIAFVRGGALIAVGGQQVLVR